ncbi:MAG: hypothetical protein J0I79_11755 [Mesorhizobium sp.]|uniref:hypothetical protein n=1 Tax=Mesorhizobium sp. TaxID=1871066 RepID=UPI001AD3B05A|nr:hypothetical protein [Mesorhizobium sp.]MBN9218619.1 hypothetical protein [Mesorhizobium sp.]
MTDKIFTGAALEEALKNDDFGLSGTEMTGMVKASKKAGHIAFTRSGCENWVDIPIGLIEKAEQLGKAPCKDHWHPIFKLTLKEPKDAEARVFAALLAAVPQGGGRPPQGWPAGGPPMQPQPMPHMGSGSSFSRAAASAPGRGSPPGSMGGRPQTVARMAGGLGGFGGLGNGGLNAWGCWESECCECIQWGNCWYTGDGRCIPECLQYACEPCERCIWPW